MVAPSWEQFQRPQKEIPLTNSSTFKEEEKPQPQQQDWANFKTPSSYQGEPDPTADESYLGYFTRNFTAIGSRLAEQAFGKYGNIEQMGKDLLVNSPKALGLFGQYLHEFIGPERWERMIRGPKGKEFQIFPTSEQLKEISQTASGGYTKPKTPGEESAQTVIEDIGSTLGGRGAPKSLKQKAINHIVIPVTANAVGKVVDELGFGEGKAAWAKTGTWVLGSLLGNVDGRKHASELMNEGRNGIPASLQADLKSLNYRLDQAEKQLLSSDPRTALARKQIASIRQDLANGQTSVRSLMNSYDGTNAAKRDAGLFSMNSSDRNYAKKAINQVQDILREEISYAARNYPKAINSWKNGIQSWAAIHQSQAISNWVQDLARGPYSKALGGPAFTLFTGGAYGAYKAPFIASSAAAALPPAYKAGQVAFRAIMDPNLRVYYWNAIRAAQEQNIPAFINNYNRLNKGLEKSEPREKKSQPKKHEAVNKKES